VGDEVRDQGSAVARSVEWPPEAKEETMSAGDKWTLNAIGNHVWLYRLDGDEPLVYYYHENFRNFVKAPLYIDPTAAKAAEKAGLSVPTDAPASAKSA
jgi:hypothetical protein